MVGELVAVDRDWLAARLGEGPEPLAQRTRTLVEESGMSTSDSISIITGRGSSTNVSPSRARS